MLNSEIKFVRNGAKYRFNLVHNLDEYGLSIDAALINWSERTKLFNIDSFCEYVISKDPVNLICMTKSKYDKLIVEPKNQNR